MTTVRDLERLEEQMKSERGWKRGEFCREIGISQSRLRRQLEAGATSEVPRTLGLAMAAVAAGLKPYQTP